MRWGRSLGLGATLVAGIAGLPACGADPESVTSASTGAMTVATTAMTETSDAPSTDGASTDVSTTATPPATEAVRVAITGVPLFADDGAVELCPYEAASCFGIAVSGGLDPTLAGETVRLVGTYDGVSVTPDPDTTAEVVEGAFDRDPDYSTPCDGMRNPSLSPDDRSTYEAIAGYLESVPDALAGAWIDQVTQVMNYWFVGDDATVAIHRQAIEDLAGETDVCVIGGARFSESELSALQSDLSTLAQARGITSSGSSADTLSNTVVASFHAIDGALRTEIDDLSDAIRAHAFIELLDDPLAALPPHRPPVEGTVDILTQPDGGRGGMEALGTFVVRWDEALGCHYLDGGDGRSAGVWPDGYSATGDPFTLYDFDGEVVATDGDTIETGGGFTDIGGTRYVGEPALCGADGLWIVTR